MSTPQHAVAGGEESRYLLRPHAAIGGQGVGEIDDGGALVADDIEITLTSVGPQKHSVQSSRRTLGPRAFSGKCPPPRRNTRAFTPVFAGYGWYPDFRPKMRQCKSAQAVRTARAHA